MNLIAYYRNQILTVALAVSVVGFGYWWLTRYQPRQEVLAQNRELLAAQEARIRSARQQMVEMGVAEAEQMIEQYRSESDRLMRRVPMADQDAQSASHMTEAMSSAASRYNVRLHAVQPLPRTQDGEFNVDGFRVQVAGRYHDVGSFLTDLLSFERITQISEARLDVVPDELLASATGDERRGRRASVQLGALPVDPGLQSEGVSLPEGEAPFNVSAVFTMNWFSSVATSEMTVSDATGMPAPTLNAF